MQILQARIVLPISAPPIENGRVAIEDGRITAVGSAAEVEGSEVVDLGEVILSPGLINAHCHLDYTIMRGAILQQSSFTNWIKRINELKRTLSDEDYLQSISDGFAELLRWGTTSVFNIESFPELMVRLPPPPIRTWWFYELLDIRNRVHTEDVVVGALTFFDKRPNWLGGFGLSPHAPYTTSPKLYELVKFCCEKYAMPWTTHLAETEEELAMFVKASGPLHDFLKGLGRRMDDTGGVTPVSRLFSRDAVPLDGMLVHMNCLTESDFNLLAVHRERLSVVHCPGCHEYFERPRFELERFLSIGVPICLGTDSLASNTSLNLFEEMRTLRKNHPDVPAQDILDMVTRNPARAIGQRGLLGEISVDARADLIAVPYSGPMANTVDAILENRAAIDWVMVDGQVIRSGSDQST